MRIRSLYPIVVFVAFAWSVGACGGGSTDQIVLTDPAIEPAVDGSPTGDVATTPDAGGDSVVRGPAPAPDGAATGFTLDLSDASLPTGPAAEDPDVAGPAGQDPVTRTAKVARFATATEDRSFRFTTTLSLSMRLDGTEIEMPPTVLGTGEFDGERAHQRTDLGPMFDAMLGSAGVDPAMVTTMFGPDLTIETIDDPRTLYVRAPILAHAAAIDPSAPAALAEAGERWLRIDRSVAQGISERDLSELAGAQTGMSPTEIFDLLSEEGFTVTEIGTTTVNGVAVTAYSLAIDDGAASDAFGELPDGAAFDMTVDVYVAADDLVHRVSVVMDADLAAQGSMHLSMVTDLADHGSDIVIGTPADSVEATALLAELFEG